MTLEPTTRLFTSLGGMVNLPRSVEALRTTYRDARPFPHLILDNLFPADILDCLLEEMSGLREQQWRLVESRSRERVRRMRSIDELGASGTQLVNLLHGAAFLYLLSELTGIDELLPDPYLQGAGYAAMHPGDFFAIHSDRSVAYETGLTRRLALIVFLNKGWDRSYNGQLELWNPEATRCEVSVEPAYNRTVIFEVAVPNYHGVPAPIACPVGLSRKSFIVYFHTVGIRGKGDVIPHSSIFARDRHREHSKLARLAREVTPPLLFNLAKKLIRR